MNAIPDKFAQWDAAYVLGALSPAERREFEEHLASCPPCQAEVSELAAIPGLLAQVSPADAALLAMTVENQTGHGETSASGVDETELIEPAPPPSLLPKMIKKVRARRRRMLAAVAGIAAAVMKPIRSSWSTDPVTPRRSRNGPPPRTSRCDQAARLR